MSGVSDLPPTFSGVVLASRDSQTVIEQCQGFTAPGSTIAITRDTKFPACSITKLFTASLIAGMADDGKLTLDDPLGKWLDWLPSFAQAVTIRQCLTHSSGLRSMDEAGEIGPDGVAEVYFSQQEALRSLRPRIQSMLGDKLGSASGEKFSYNNLDFLLLEAVVESASGKPYEALFNEKIAMPLGLKETVRVGWGEPARDYAVSFAKVAETRFNFALYGGAGGYGSTASEVLRFGEALLAQRIPGAKTLLNEPAVFGFVGLGAFRYDVEVEGRSVPVLDRGGEIAHFHHDLLLCPAEKVVVVVMSNSEASAFPLAYTGGGLPLETLRRSANRTTSRQ